MSERDREIEDRQKKERKEERKARKRNHLVMILQANKPYSDTTHMLPFRRFFLGVFVSERERERERETERECMFWANVCVWFADRKREREREREGECKNVKGSE